MKMTRYGQWLASRSTLSFAEWNKITPNDQLVKWSEHYTKEEKKNDKGND